MEKKIQVRFSPSFLLSMTMLGATQIKRDDTQGGQEGAEVVGGPGG